MPDDNLRRYIQYLPGSDFWTPARVVGGTMMVNPTAAPAAAAAVSPYVVGPRKLQRLPVPKAEEPHDEASAARYGARWYREHAADARRDVADQVQEQNRRNSSERDLAKAEGDYKNLTGQTDRARDEGERLQRSAEEYRKFLRK
jgi:hypothetical protein